MKDLMIKLRSLPSFETTVSVVKVWISSRLNMLGVGRGNGTLFSNISRGVANA